MKNNQFPVISLANVSACYRIPSESIYSIKEYIIRLIRLKLPYITIDALKGINLEVKKGEVVGVIGRNGAGKSTLLKLISRVLPPSSGRIIVNGRVAPLLTLGAGFDPELSGRENIFLNGAILCLSQKEISEKMEEIIAFSGLAHYIDNPIRTYSSGMTARLGFSIATAVFPEILVIDEILSVGDEEFRDKSYNRILEYKDRDTTIILVSHNLGVIRKLCTRVIWLENGKIRMQGEPEFVTSSYNQSKAKGLELLE